MAKFGRQGTTGSFITEMVLILAIILASKVSQVRMEPPTQEYCPNIKSITNDNGTCVASDHCSKVVCTALPDNTGPFSRMSVQAFVCNQSVKANVSLESPSVKWSHTFADGEKVALPDAMKPDDAPSSLKQFMIVELMKNDPYIHYKIVQIFDMGFMNYNTTLQEGDLDAAECESHATEAPIPTMGGGDDYEHKGSHDENCPDIQLPDGSDGTCVLDDHCSKVTCTSPPDSAGPFNHMVLTVQAYGCGHQPMKAEVSLKSSSVKWSHTFKDGERAAMPVSMKPPDVPVNMKIFLEVELKKNGGKVHFKLLLLFESVIAPYNVTFLEGDLHASKCGSWFSRQSNGVKATVIIIPLLAVILLVLVLTFICCKKRQDGKRVMVNFFPGKDKIGMQRLSNEI